MSIIYILAGLIGGFFSVYGLITCFGGLLVRRHVVSKRKAPACRIAAVVAARNESAVIGELIESLLAQKYPRELIDVCVVPNNCTDDTEAVAKAAGARIVPCTVPVHSKGEVLSDVLPRLSVTGRYDVYCIFDADNIVDPMFFQHVNDAWDAGVQVAQGFRDSKNPYDNWLSGCMSAFYWFMSHFFNESRFRLGLSCQLNGTGFMVSNEVIRRNGWKTVTLTEDLEYTAQCALNGVRVNWMPEARTYDEQPTSLMASAVQRRRWTSGSLQCMRGYAKDLLMKGTPSSLDAGCFFLANLLNYTGLLTMILALSQILKKLSQGTFPLAQTLTGSAFSLLTYLISCWAVAAILFWLEHKLKRKALPAILGFPLFMASWLPINLVACFTRPPQWTNIRHGTRRGKSVNLTDDMV